MSDIVDTSPNLSNPQVPVAPAANGSASGTVASTTTPAETADGEQPQPAEGTDPKPPRDRRAEKRISRLTQQREAAIQQAGYWRGVAEARAPQSEPPADGSQPQQQTRQAPAVDPGEVEHSKTVLDRIREAGEDSDDFDDVMETLTSDDFKVSRTMRDFLGESKKPFELAKALTDNPKRAARIARLDPAVAVEALKELTAELTAKVPRTTNTPPPPPTVNGRGTPQISLESASMEDFVKIRNEQRAKAGYR